MVDLVKSVKDSGSLSCLLKGKFLFLKLDFIVNMGSNVCFF